MWWGPRGGALLGLLLVNREGLVSDVITGGCLGHSNHKIMQFFVHGEVKSWVSRNCKLGLLEGRLWMWHQGTWLSCGLGSAG